ncbi:MAG: hypothetical protein KGL95_08145 [Patescibacteria group bacterium]|nr:hypothetical protein [Patescibacteria group bacterium]
MSAEEKLMQKNVHKSCNDAICVIEELRKRGNSKDPMSAEEKLMQKDVETKSKDAIHAIKELQKSLNLVSFQ